MQCTALKQDRDDRFTGITGPDNELQCDQHRFGRVTVTGYPIQLEQQPVTRISGGAYGVGRHIQDVPQPPRLILVHLLFTVILGPGHTIGPDCRCQRNRPDIMSPVKCYEELEDKQKQ